jgi:hypothetical protein
MNVSIRIIGIATMFFWTFLIAFAVSAVYSIKDLQFNFGEARFSISPNHGVLFSLPICIDNDSYYSIDSFNITTEFSDSEGDFITKGFTLVPVIPKGEDMTIFHNVTLDLDDSLGSGQQYLFNDSELRIATCVGMRFAEVFPVEASTNFSIPWGAPFYNFILEEPKSAEFNSTHQMVAVPLSFENHAPFDLSGEIQLKIYNEVGMLLGEKQAAFEVLRFSTYNGQFELYVQGARFTPTGRFEVYFLTPFLDYGPLVIPYG